MNQNSFFIKKSNSNGPRRSWEKVLPTEKKNRGVGRNPRKAVGTRVKRRRHLVIHKTDRLCWREAQRKRNVGRRKKKARVLGFGGRKKRKQKGSFPGRASRKPAHSNSRFHGSVPKKKKKEPWEEKGGHLQKAASRGRKETGGGYEGDQCLGKIQIPFTWGVTKGDVKGKKEKEMAKVRG